MHSKSSRVARTVLALGALVISGSARAGRTSHLYTEEAQIVTEGEVELENWVWENTRPWGPSTRAASAWLWWGPVVGVSPHLELELPLQVVASPDRTFLGSVEFAARYRIFPKQDDEGFQPLVRLGYEHSLSEYLGPPRIDVGFVGTWERFKSFRLNVNVGGLIGLPMLSTSSRPGNPFTGTASFGASVPLPKGLRLAGEVYGTLEFPPASSSGVRGQLYVGPSLAWTRGPFWVSVGSLVGLTSDSSRFLPRIRWAVAL